MTNPASKIQPLREERFDGTKLQFARERINLSGKQLAAAVAASPSFISACEKGRKRPSGQLQLLLAHELQVTPGFFYGEPFENWHVADCHYRHRQAATKSEKRRMRSQLFFYSRILNAVAQIVRLPTINLPSVSPGGQCDPEEIANDTRRLWNIGMANPIGHFCRLVERAGLVILFHSNDIKSIDAASHLGRIPLILVTKTNRGTSRIRSDIGHELGELIFHCRQATAAHEKQVNQFVGAFTMPREGFEPHFRSKSLGLSHLWELKRTWGVSLSAILQRALELGLLAEVSFVQWKRRIASRGWSRSEPNESPFLGPEILKRSMAVLVEKKISLTELAEHVGIAPIGLAELLHANGLGTLMAEHLLTTVTPPSTSGGVQDTSCPLLRIIK
jgi:Zn-dependent peptidase ImmA (M78 family)/transcriptional regulator with XRE-family HTH domain